ISGIETTFITVISAPLIIGIGVDALVYVVHSSGKRDEKELARTLKSITMSSATTMLAFFSFAFAEGKLLSSFGLSLASGVLMSLVVATFLVPVLPWNSKERNGG
ncbi:MAG: RND transporter, partial [Mesotoga sp.]|nr:RND transporter [Mesotoga sp.]